MSLPSGYNQVEYIESSGTQYINTGVKPKTNTRMVMTAQVLSSQKTEGHLASVVTSDAALFFVLSLRPVSGVMTYATRYGTSALTPFPTSVTPYGKHVFDKNKGVTKIDDETVTVTSGAFQIDKPLTLFARNAASGKIDAFTSMKLYECKIYDGTTLIRDFVPCRRTDTTPGLYDLVNNAFYENAGSGTFSAPEVVAKKHTTLIAGTAYAVKGGRALIAGAGHAIKGGNALVGGTKYAISFSTGTPIGDLAVGQTVKIAVNGTLKDFIIVHHGKPGTIYDDSCNGTWLLMKDIYETRVWNNTTAGSGTNALESSKIHTYLNGDFLNLIDENAKSLIKDVKIPYRKGSGISDHVQTGANGLSAKVFLLSGYEVGFTTSDQKYFVVDGAKLDYFAAGTGTAAKVKRIAYLNGTATVWWLRTPYRISGDTVWCVGTDGSYDAYEVYTVKGVRPAFVVPQTITVAADGKVSV